MRYQHIEYSLLYVNDGTRTLTARHCTYLITYLHNDSIFMMRMNSFGKMYLLIYMFNIKFVIQRRLSSFLFNVGGRSVKCINSKPHWKYHLNP